MSKKVGKNTGEMGGEWGMPPAEGSNLSPAMQYMHPVEMSLIKSLLLTSDEKGHFHRNHNSS